MVGKVHVLQGSDSVTLIQEPRKSSTASAPKFAQGTTRSVPSDRL